MIWHNDFDSLIKNLKVCRYVYGITALSVRIVVFRVAAPCMLGGGYTRFI